MLVQLVDQGSTPTLRMIAREVFGLSLLTATSVAAVWAGSAPLSVPAELVTVMDLPGVEDHLLRPSALFVDETFGEVLVADAGHNRIVIFDDEANYRFEFSGLDVFSLPLDVIVERNGCILVLGSTPEGRKLFRFDFDGVFLGEVAFQPPADSPVDPRSLDRSRDGTLLVLDGDGPRVRLYTEDGRLAHAFFVRDVHGQPVSKNEVIGQPHVRDGHVFVPLPAHGSVYVYDLAGTFQRAIGRKGTNVGELSFPVGAALTDGGLLLVLDKNRYNVGCYDLDGRFVGEFGGRGARPGWYYHPTLLAVAPDDRVYIGQVFQNRVDVCRVPGVIRERYAGERQDVGEEREVAKTVDHSPNLKEREQPGYDTAAGG